MNILVPDSWLCKFLKTNATPSQIKEYLSLCGPSVERVYEDSGEPVYDIEITTNRPDAMSVFGIAREASVILPRFGIAAELINDPYTMHKKIPKNKTGDKKLRVLTDASLNPRWTSVVLTNISIKDSPDWLKNCLIKTGIRPINTVVDVTNYLMRAYGQPAHAFDYDKLGTKNGIPTMKLRLSKKGEKLTTLDGKIHTLPGDDIVIEDGTGRLIDLCGIMGGENSSITGDTASVVLFLQTYSAPHIRKTSMKLAHRTEAAALFEKGVDSELVMPAIQEGIRLLQEIAGATPASALLDEYPAPYKPYCVSVTEDKLRTYLGTALPDKEIQTILTSLGFETRKQKNAIAVTVPSFRRDVTLDVDIIEEVARIHGYHAITSKLPEGEMPSTLPDPELAHEEELKIRLRDWGFTEIITYSMISDHTMKQFGQDTTRTYKLYNPLSADWVYMRPHLMLSMFSSIKKNLATTAHLKLFELGNSYEYRKNDLPKEVPTLIVIWAGEHFLEAKGLAESILKIFGLDHHHVFLEKSDHPTSWYSGAHLTIGEFGSLGILDKKIVSASGINTPITRIYMDVAKLSAASARTKHYIPIPKHPPSAEDLAFIVPNRFAVGPLIDTLKHAHPYVYDVTLLDIHDDTRTFHVTYLNPEKTLTSEEIAGIRQMLLSTAQKTYHITLKNK